MKAGERGNRFEPYVRLCIGRLDELQHRRQHRPIADSSERTDRFDDDRGIAAREKRHERRKRGAALQRRQSFYGEGARVGMRFLRQREKRRQRAGVLQSLQREGDRPRPHARIT